MLVAALDDVEDSKRTANRAKDREYVEGVGRLTAPAAPELADLKRIHQANTPHTAQREPTAGQRSADSPHPTWPSQGGSLER